MSARQGNAASMDGPASPYSSYFGYAPADDPSTILLPGDHPAQRESVVRPALAVLYRVAIGPSADRYVKRFLAFERKGRGRPGWHWPSLLFPGVWAFYRKMWLLGTAFALLPVAGALAFDALSPLFREADLAWIVCAIAAVWILPGVLPALFADSLLYGHVRHVVASTEARAKSVSDALQRLATRSPTSMVAACLLGGGGIVGMLAVVVPPLHAAYVDLGIRARVGQALQSVHKLEDEIEADWYTSRMLPRQTDHPGLRAHEGAALIDDVHVHPATGRIKLAFGASVPALDGKTILLAPSRDMDNRWRWLCFPVDIPQRWLPRECR
ncbi:MAG: DUF2628 domain-containing protein [Burkholderiales bacterium]